MLPKNLEFSRKKAGGSKEVSRLQTFPHQIPIAKKWEKGIFEKSLCLELAVTHPREDNWLIVQLI